MKITQEAIRTVHKHAEQDFPNECCGFLYGNDEPERIVNKAIPVGNSKEGDQSRRFEISALDYMKAEKYALQNNCALLGIYHSHPGHPAIASEHDRKQAVPYFSYLITSVMKGQVADDKSWLLNEQEQFEEESVIILK